jgi:hypothetical protein
MGKPSSRKVCELDGTRGATAETWARRERVAQAIDVDGACSAQPHAAAILGAVQVEGIAPDPEERRVGAHIHGFDSIVNLSGLKRLRFSHGERSDSA